jgi:ribosomal protein S18 acetylase RimI-like enzyme
MDLDSSIIAVEPLVPSDILAVAQCLVVDAEVFPLASGAFVHRWPRPRVWIARGPDRRVGGFVASIPRVRDRYVDALGVRQVLQRRGIGRALLHAAMDDARATGATSMTLHVSVGNAPAIALYCASGFSERRRIRDFYRPGLFESGRDAYEMRRELP